MWTPAIAKAVAGAALLAAAVAAVSVPADDGNEKVSAFSRCFAMYNCLSLPRTSWEFLTNDLAGCQSLSRVWWSAKPPGIPVTLVTQLSLNRLDQLRAQCASWRGPLAAAVFLPLVNPSLELSTESKETLQEASTILDGFFKASELNSTQGCGLRLALLYELYEDADTVALTHPLNTLRNYARLLADTDLITNIDVDLLPSLSISTALANPKILAEYSEGCRRGNVYVFPAFESHCNRTEDADDIARAGKEALKGALNSCVTTFSPKYHQFHGPTLHNRWLEGDEMYPITYHLLFEPWYLSWRLATQWFDFRYRGYGYNKIVQVAAANASGASWFVSPHGFLLHRPHAASHMKTQYIFEKSHYNGTLARDTLYGHMQDLWNTAEDELRGTGRLAVRVEDSFRWCLQSLPWWRSEPSMAAPVLSRAKAAKAGPKPATAAAAAAATPKRSPKLALQSPPQKP